MASRKEIHDNYLKNGGSTNYVKKNSDGSESIMIGNVNTADGKTNYATNPPPSPDNIRYKNNIETLDYFRTLDVKNFKHGLELGNTNNLDEDPVIFGFDLVINTLTSPLYSAKSPKSEFTGDLEAFFKFGDVNNIEEIKKRRPVYEEFMSHMEKLFLTTNAGKFDTFKAHYLKSIDGLDKLVNQDVSSVTNGKQFTKYGEDKITLKIYEDNSLNGGLMAMLYNTMSYNKLRGKVIIPDNLLRFDCSIIISEIRNYNMVKETIENSSGDPINFNDTQSIVGINKSLKVFNDNVSRYIYNLYDCQFMFNNMSHESSVSNETLETTDSWDISFLYKFASLSMEKFTLNPNNKNQQYSTFLNNAGVDPRKNSSNGAQLSSTSSGSDGIGTSPVFGYGYNSRENPYKDLNKVSSNGVVYTNEDINYNDDRNQIKDLEKNSEKAKRDGIAERDEEGKDRTTIGSILKGTGNLAIQKIKTARDNLINDTIQRIRTATGLRRISSPINVYYDNNSIPGFLRNGLRDFTNERVTDFLGRL